MKRVLALLSCVLLLCACAPKAVPPLGAASGSPHDSGSVADEPFSQEEPPYMEENYVRELAKEIVDGMDIRGAEPETQILAAYRWLMENVYFADPVGLDIWRFRSNQTTLPTFLENRALSPLAFGVGSCEDFACAMVVLLEEMGFEALYLPGFTISVEGDYVDHAWAVVQIGEEWYHLDPQLEQNIVRGGLTRYRYFLKSDADMAADHKWGENLIAYWQGLSDEDERRIRELYTPPVCGISAPQRQQEPVSPPSCPDIASLLHQLEEERLRQGPLPEIELNTSPPVLIGG